MNDYDWLTKNLSENSKNFLILWLKSTKKRKLQLLEELQTVFPQYTGNLHKQRKIIDKCAEEHREYFESKDINLDVIFDVEIYENESE